MSDILVHHLILPHKSLNEAELEDAVFALGIPRFRGIFMRDALPPDPQPIECGILNHDDNDGRGTHWTCWHKRGELKEYFDPFGLPPPNEMKDYLRPEIRYSTDELQSRVGVVCGHFCLYVLKMLSDGWEIDDAVFSL